MFTLDPVRHASTRSVRTDFAGSCDPREFVCETKAEHEECEGVSRPRGGLLNTGDMKSRSQDQSLSDSRDLDRSHDPLTGKNTVIDLLPLSLHLYQVASKVVTTLRSSNYSSYCLMRL